MEKALKVIGWCIFTYLITIWSLYLFGVENRGLTIALGLMLSIVVFFIYMIKNIKPNLKKQEISKPPTFYRVDEFDCVVSGSQFNAYNGVPRESYIEDLEQYDPLTLSIQKDNEFDKNAVLVMFDEIDIGYIPKMFSKKITNYINAGHKIDAFVKKTYKKDKYLNCIIVIEIFEKR